VISIKEEKFGCFPNKNRKNISENCGKKKSFIVNRHDFIYQGQDIDKFTFTISIGIKDGKIRYLPFIIRHILSKAIYFLLKSKPTLSREQIIDSLIENLITKNINLGWVKEMEEKGILTYLHNKFQDSNFEQILRDYLKDLIEIIYRLVDFANKTEPFKVKPFCIELTKDGYNLGMQTLSLIKIITKLIKYLNKSIKDFNIQLIELKSIKDDGTLRVCNKCGIKKPYDEFSIDREGTNGLLSICKDCVNKEYAVMQSIKKLNVINRIYNGRFNDGKCVKCGIDTIYLPCLTFHHQNPLIKKYYYGEIADLPSDEIIRLFESEDVQLLCFNCQRLIHAKLFDRFKYLILDPYLYGYTIREIDDIILNFREKYNLEGEVSAVKYWMKKRAVIDYLFNSRCVGCGKMTVLNNLPCLEFHHIDPRVEGRLRWSKIKHLNIKTIINRLLREKCICLCKNCHKLIDSHQFARYSIEILGKDKGQLAKNEYNKLVNNVQKYNIVKNTRLYLILVEFTLDKAWKRALRCVYIITETKKKEGVMLNHNEYTNKELSNCTKILQAKSYTQKLIKMNLVSFLRYSGSNINEKVYSLTKKGYDVINEILFNF